MPASASGAPRRRSPRRRASRRGRSRGRAWREARPAVPLPPRRRYDETLQDPCAAFQVLKRHYARYTPQLVAEVTAACRRPRSRGSASSMTENSGRERTTAFVYSVGWTHHTSDVCKHCTESACLDVCPTGALFRTEFGTVVVQDDVCNGCGYCVGACPFGVIARREEDGQAHKCTLCYDRLGAGMEPACAKACPTESIQFGPLDELREQAALRVADLRAPARLRPSSTWTTRTTASAAAGLFPAAGRARGVRPAAGSGRHHTRPAQHLEARRPGRGGLVAAGITLSLGRRRR